MDMMVIVVVKIWPTPGSRHMSRWQEHESTLGNPFWSLRHLFEGIFHP